MVMPMAEGLGQMIFKGPFQSKAFYDSVVLRYENTLLSNSNWIFTETIQHQTVSTETFKGSREAAEKKIHFTLGRRISSDILSVLGSNYNPGYSHPELT